MSLELSNATNLATFQAAVGISTIKPRPVAIVRVATFGDSTANFTNISAGSIPADVRSLTAAFPGSGATVISQYSNKNALDYFYPAAAYVGDGGISGQTTSQMVARTPGGISSTNKAAEDILGLWPDTIFYRGGSINDFTTITSSGIAAAVATATSNATQILQRLGSDGALILVHGIYGYSGAGATDPVSTRAALVLQNAALSALCATLGNQYVYVDPVVVGLSDATGLYYTTMTADGTHLSPLGQYILDKYVASILTNRFGPSSTIRFASTNVVTNATMYSSTSGLATGFATTVTNATRVTTVQNIKGKNWQIATVTPTAVNGLCQIDMPYNPSATGAMAISSGDIWGFEFDWFVTGANGATVTPAQMDVHARIDTYKSAAGRVVVDHVVTAGFWSSVANGAMQGHMVLGPLQYSDVSANLTTSSLFWFQVTNQLDTTPFVMGVANPRIVKLGQAQLSY